MHANIIVITKISIYFKAKRKPQQLFAIVYFFQTKDTKRAATAHDFGLKRLESLC